MNRSKIITVIVVITGIIFINYLTDKNFRNKILPDGNLIQETTSLDSDAIITPEPISGHPQVEINTTKGKFVIELSPELAPKSVVNFLGKWSSGYCVGKTFHRVEDWVIQGCDPLGDGSGGKDNLLTEISKGEFTTGAVGVARKIYPENISNDSQFFIVKKDSANLNGKYSYLGRVISGMDIVNNLTAGDKITATTVLTK